MASLPNSEQMSEKIVARFRVEQLTEAASGILSCHL